MCIVFVKLKYARYGFMISTMEHSVKWYAYQVPGFVHSPDKSTIRRQIEHFSNFADSSVCLVCITHTVSACVHSVHTTQCVSVVLVWTVCARFAQCVLNSATASSTSPTFTLCARTPSHGSRSTLYHSLALLCCTSNQLLCRQCAAPTCTLLSAPVQFHSRWSSPSKIPSMFNSIKTNTSTRDSTQSSESRHQAALMDRIEQFCKVVFVWERRVDSAAEWVGGWAVGRVRQAALYHRWRQQEGPTMEVTRRLNIIIICLSR